jgi:predicted DNA-binding protein
MSDATDDAVTAERRIRTDRGYISLSAETSERLAMVAKRLGMSMAEVVEMWVKEMDQ